MDTRFAVRAPRLVPRTHAAVEVESVDSAKQNISVFRDDPSDGVMPKRAQDTGHGSFDTTEKKIVARLHDYGVVDARLCVDLAGDLQRLIEKAGKKMLVVRTRSSVPEVANTASSYSLGSRTPE